MSDCLHPQLMDVGMERARPVRAGMLGTATKRGPRCSGSLFHHFWWHEVLSRAAGRVKPIVVEDVPDCPRAELEAPRDLLELHAAPPEKPDPLDARVARSE